MNIKRILANLDFWLIGAVCILSVFGIICIGSATHINLGEDPSNYYSQMVWLGVGVVIMFLMLFVNYKFFSKYYLIIYGVNILMLIAVLLFGKNVNGATRWIYLGPIGIQPSEFSKLIIIFCLAK